MLHTSDTAGRPPTLAPILQAVGTLRCVHTSRIEGVVVSLIFSFLPAMLSTTSAEWQWKMTTLLQHFKHLRT